MHQHGHGAGRQVEQVQGAHHVRWNSYHAMQMIIHLFLWR